MQHRIQPEHRPLHQLILFVVAQPIHVWALVDSCDFDRHAYRVGFFDGCGHPRNSVGNDWPVNLESSS